MSDSVPNPLAQIKGSAHDQQTQPAPATTEKPTAAATPDFDSLFKEKNAELITTLESLKATVAAKEQAATEAARKVAEFENKAKEAERSKMSDVERIKAEMADQQKQLQDLLKTNIELKNQMAEESIKNVKNGMLTKSGLREEFHKFVHGSDPVEIKKQIDDLVSLQNTIKNEALSAVPSVVRSESVGAPPASPSPAAEQDSSEEVSKYKGAKNIKDLASLFYKDAAAKAALLQKR